MIGNLYSITNTINGKMYIGLTYRQLSVRFKEHVTDAKNNVNRPLCNALNKYGVSSFKLELLGQYEEGLLEQAEIQAIRDYNCMVPRGYNVTAGGDGSRTVKYTDEDIAAKYLELKDLTACGIALGLDPLTCRTALVRSGININSSQSIARSKSPPVYCIDTDMYFSTVYDCAQLLLDCEIPETKDLNSIARSIHRVCDGSRKSYKNLHFAYID